MLRRQITFTLRTQQAGLALIDFLTARFTYRTREAWLESIAKGELALDGHTCDNPSITLQVGMVLAWTPPAVEEPKVDWNCPIVFEDEHLCAVNKSGDLPCHPGGRYFNHTLWAVLKERGLDDPIFVNRLDRETSGLVLVARSPEAAKNLRTQFAHHQVEKTYIAFVEDAFAKSITARGELAPDADSAIRKKQLFTPSAEGKVVTQIDPVAVHGAISEVRVKPLTGKLHQIRATLLALGYPIVGDKLYGTDELRFLRFLEDGLTPQDMAALRIGRQALHAAELEFTHPHTNERMTLSAPLSLDLEGVRKIAPRS